MKRLARAYEGYPAGFLFEIRKSDLKIEAGAKKQSVSVTYISTRLDVC